MDADEALIEEMLERAGREYEEALLLAKAAADATPDDDGADQSLLTGAPVLTEDSEDEEPDVK